MTTFELTYILGILALAIFALAIALMIYTDKKYNSNNRR